MKAPRVTSCLLNHRKSIVLKTIDEAHLGEVILQFFFQISNIDYSKVASWGLKQGDKAAFRPAMALSSGQLSGLGGQLLLMTATATSKTIRLLMDQMPEITNWKLMFNSPFCENVTILVPPPESLSAKFEVVLEPFISRMRLEKEVFLILVRGILFYTHHFLHICT